MSAPSSNRASADSSDEGVFKRPHGHGSSTTHARQLHTHAPDAEHGEYEAALQAEIPDFFTPKEHTGIQLSPFDFDCARFSLWLSRAYYGESSLFESIAPAFLRDQEQFCQMVVSQLLMEGEHRNSTLSENPIQLFSEVVLGTFHRWFVEAGSVDEAAEFVEEHYMRYAMAKMRDERNALHPDHFQELAAKHQLRRNNSLVCVTLFLSCWYQLSNHPELPRHHPFSAKNEQPLRVFACASLDRVWIGVKRTEAERAPPPVHGSASTSVGSLAPPSPLSVPVSPLAPPSPLYPFVSDHAEFLLGEASASHVVSDELVKRLCERERTRPNTKHARSATSHWLTPRRFAGVLVERWMARVVRSLRCDHNRVGRVAELGRFLKLLLTYDARLRLTRSSLFWRLVGEWCSLPVLRLPAYNKERDSLLSWALDKLERDDDERGVGNAAAVSVAAAAFERALAISPHHVEVELAVASSRRHPDTDRLDETMRTLDALGRRLETLQGRLTELRTALASRYAGSIDMAAVRLRVGRARAVVQGHKLMDDMDGRERMSEALVQPLLDTLVHTAICSESTSSSNYVTATATTSTDTAATVMATAATAATATATATTTTTSAIVDKAWLRVDLGAFEERAAGDINFVARNREWLEWTVSRMQRDLSAFTDSFLRRNTYFCQLLLVCGVIANADGAVMRSDCTRFESVNAAASNRGDEELLAFTSATPMRRGSVSGVGTPVSESGAADVSSAPLGAALRAQPRQPLFVCLTCHVGDERTAVCVACATHCHRALGHHVALVGRRRLVCDCASPDKLDVACTLLGAELPSLNADEVYTHNFEGPPRFCYMDGCKFEGSIDADFELGVMLEDGSRTVSAADTLECSRCESLFHGVCSFTTWAEVDEQATTDTFLCNLCYDAPEGAQELEKKRIDATDGALEPEKKRQRINE